MPLTRSFKKTVQARLVSDMAFRQAVLGEAVAALLEGDLATGRSMLRDLANATIGFQRLAELTGAPAKSLMRMLSPRGNPTAANLFAVIGALQKTSGVSLEVRPVPSGGMRLPVG